MKNYNEVPSMISSKDLDYLCDIYNWNFNACKVANNLIGKVEDEEIKSAFNNTYLIHLENVKQVLEILK